MRRLATLALMCVTALGSAHARSHPFTLEDLAALREVSSPRISPDGAWVAYTVTFTDIAKDRATSDIWMTSWDGVTTLRMTAGNDSEHLPRFSPDNRYLAFLSDRDNELELGQVWLMSRGGGEAQRITSLPGGVSDFAWSPDGKRLVLVGDDPDPAAVEAHAAEKDGKNSKPVKPIVIDRYQFKTDDGGYLGRLRSHLYLLDVETRKVETLTSGEFHELSPEWSPDGATIAFVSKRGADFDRHENWEIHVVEAKTGGAARQVTRNDLADCSPDFDSRPSFSPDGMSILCVQGGPQSLIYYAVHQAVVVPAAGGQTRALAPGLDRNMTQTRWSADGAFVYFLLEDDRTVHLARVPRAGGKVEPVTTGQRVLTDYTLDPGGKIAVLAATASMPPEVYALEGGAMRPLSRQNDAMLAGVRLGAVSENQFKSKDGTPIHGLMITPPDYKPGTSYPTLLRPHGGPVGQYGHEFEELHQLLAAQGYVVLLPNPRGSSGRGEAFSREIWADWGNKDAQDVLAAVDDAVGAGIADPQRLGIGGWSYGGMMTNYVIAQDNRFKGAVSGSSISNILAGYGTDQYIREYEAELGVPWKHLDLWLKNSTPFLHADRIVTPTLFMCGDKDFNVPLLNSEQMYQALRSLGRDTQLIIYPGEHHGLKRPSFLRDRIERMIAWYGKYVKGEGTN